MLDQITPLRVHGYLRVSSGEQADTRLGLDTQRQAIERACEYRGYELIGFYEDAGKSGAKMTRPALQEAIANVRPGEGIIVSKLDRLSRSVGDFAALVKLAQKRRWHPICLDPDLDLATPNGRLVANLIVSVAQWEAEITGQRMREVAQRKLERGEPTGCKPLIVGELAADIHELRAAGLTMQAICMDLERRGVPTPRGGVRWRPSSLQGVLARSA